MTTENEQYLTPDGVASIYPSLTTRWLSRRRWEHLPPAYSKVGKRVLYRRSEIERLLTDALVKHGVQS